MTNQAGLTHATPIRVWKCATHGAWQYLDTKNDRFELLPHFGNIPLREQPCPRCQEDG